MNNGDTMLFNFRKEESCADGSLSGKTAIIDTRKGTSEKTKEVITHVFSSLKEKGYDPVTQLVQYLLSGDPTYITSYNNSRVMISSLERDEIIEELLTSYLNHNKIDIM